MNTKNAKKAEPKKEVDVKDLEVTSTEVKNVRVVSGKNGDVVFFTLNLNGIDIYNCRVATGKQGDFISFPQVKGKDDKYYNTVYARLSNDCQKAILDEIQRIIDEM